ncbi:MAG: C25 family peptidase propeptide domain-containing protein, partial [Planctomycetota bacterium]
MIPALVIQLMACLIAFASGGPLESAGAAGRVEVKVFGDALDHTEIHYHLGELEAFQPVLDREKRLALSLNGEGFVMPERSGHPRIPMISRSLMIPDRARMEVRLLEAEYHDLPDVPELTPWCGPILRTVDPESLDFMIDPEIYGKDAFFPDRVISLSKPYILHRRRGVTVQCVPFQYNPVRKVLRVYTEMKVEVSSCGPGSINLIDHAESERKIGRTFEAIQAKHFINFPVRGGSR